MILPTPFGHSADRRQLRGIVGKVAIWRAPHGIQDHVIGADFGDAEVHRFAQEAVHPHWEWTLRTRSTRIECSHLLPLDWWLIWILPRDLVASNSLVLAISYRGCRPGVGPF